MWPCQWVCGRCLQRPTHQVRGVVGECILGSHLHRNDNRSDLLLRLLYVQPCRAEVRPQKQTPDCRSCGLCCISPHSQTAFADLVPKDLEKLSPRWIKKNAELCSPFDMILNGGCPGALKTRWVINKQGPLKGFEQCRCIALQGTPMVRVACSIYAKRPRVCHEAMVPGEKACLDLRRMYEEFAARPKETC
jgi:Fe-S-cluster containining protein